MLQDYREKEVLAGSQFVNVLFVQFCKTVLFIFACLGTMATVFFSALCCHCGKKRVIHQLHVVLAQKVTTRSVRLFISSVHVGINASPVSLFYIFNVIVIELFVKVKCF